MSTLQPNKSFLILALEIKRRERQQPLHIVGEDGSYSADALM